MVNCDPSARNIDYSTTKGRSVYRRELGASANPKFLKAQVEPLIHIDVSDSGPRS